MSSGLMSSGLIPFMSSGFIPYLLSKVHVFMSSFNVGRFTVHVFFYHLFTVFNTHFMFALGVVGNWGCTWWRSDLSRTSPTPKP